MAVLHKLCIGLCETDTRGEAGGSPRRARTRAGCRGGVRAGCRRALGGDQRAGRPDAVPPGRRGAADHRPRDGPLADEVAGVRRAPGPRRRRRPGTRGRAHPRPGTGRAGRGLSRCRAQPLRGPTADGLRRDLAGRRGAARRRARPGDATLARRPAVADQGGARARRRERPPRGARRAGGRSRRDGVRRRRADRDPGARPGWMPGGADRGRPDPGPGTPRRGELVGRARDHARAAARCPLPAGAVAGGVRAG